MSPSWTPASRRLAPELAARAVDRVRAVAPPEIPRPEPASAERRAADPPGAQDPAPAAQTPPIATARSGWVPVGPAKAVPAETDVPIEATRLAGAGRPALHRRPPLGCRFLLGNMPSPLQHARFGIDGRAVVGLLLVVVLAIGFGAIYLFKAKPIAEAAPRFPITATSDPGSTSALAGSDPPAAAASSGDVTASSQPATNLVVHVTGLVGRPGVVSLPRGARVVDALQAAGGALPGVDTSGLNLARALTDGEQVAVGVPGAGQPLADDSNPSGAGTTDGSGNAPAGSVVDLNRASAADLEELPGAGPVLAARIIDHRNRIGGFRSIDELQDVSGIGDRTFEDLRDKVTV